MSKQELHHQRGWYAVNKDKNKAILSPWLYPLERGDEVHSANANRYIME